MTKPVVHRCPDGHFRRVIYDLIAFIADYPEQVMLTGIVQGWCPKCVFEDNPSSDLMAAVRCTAFPDNLDVHAEPRTPAYVDGLVDNLDSQTLWIEFGIDDDIIVCYLIIIPIQHLSLMVRSQPFTSDFPRGNIYQMISPDLLHQVIKGTFKDHLVTWICEYLVIQHGERRAGVILDDIDRRYVPHAALTTHIEIVANLLVELLRCHLFLVSADFPMVGASSSGPGTTPRP